MNEAVNGTMRDPGCQARPRDARRHARGRRWLALAAALATVVSVRVAAAGPRPEIPFKIAKIYWEYNASANDLGVHVSLDAEDWRDLRIVGPTERTLFRVRGAGPYKSLGMTELFFEGAEPSLSDFPLADLLELFPEGRYDFEGMTVDGARLDSSAFFSHGIPAGPAVSAEVGAGDLVRIHWAPVTAPPPGFPARPISIAGYQVIVESFQVTVLPTVTSVTVPAEFVAGLASGRHEFEVLAVEANANQTLTEGSFILP